MIAEHEVIEQIEEEPLGRPLGWVCALLRSLGRDEPLLLIDGMLSGGYIRLLSSDSKPLPNWRWEQLLRTRVETADVLVAATDCGSRWVHEG